MIWPGIKKPLLPDADRTHDIPGNGSVGEDLEKTALSLSEKHERIWESVQSVKLY